MNRWHFAAVVAFGIFPLLGRGRAQAQDAWHLSAELSFTTPVSSPQFEWFGPGGSVAVSGWMSLAAPVAVGARLRGGLLMDGPPPADPGLRDPGLGGWGALMVGGRFRGERQRS